MSKQSEALREYFEQNGIRNKFIQEKLGLRNASLVSNMLSGKDPIGYKRAQQLHDAFGFDKEFLLTGEGMLLPPAGMHRHIETVSGSNVTQGDHSPINVTPDVSALQAEVEHLRKENERLWTTIENLTKKQ